MPPEDDISAMLVQRRLNSRDQGFKDHIDEGLNMHSYQADLATDLTPNNIVQLGRAIDAAKTPQQKAILMEQLQQLKDLASNLLGPIQKPQDMPEDFTSGVQRMPYDPATQRPQLYGGQNMLYKVRPGSM